MFFNSKMGFPAFSLTQEKETKLVTYQNVVCKVTVESLVSRQGLQTYGQQIRQQLCQLIRVAMFDGVNFGRLRVVSSHCYFYCETSPWNINAILSFKKAGQDLQQNSFCYCIKVKDKQQPPVTSSNAAPHVSALNQGTSRRATTSSSERNLGPLTGRSESQNRNNSNSVFLEIDERHSESEQPLQVRTRRNAKANRSPVVRNGSVTRKLNLRDSESGSSSETSGPRYNLRQTQQQQKQRSQKQQQRQRSSSSQRTRKAKKKESLSIIRTAKKRALKQLGKLQVHEQQTRLRGRVRRAPTRYGYEQVVDLIADEEDRLRLMKTPLRHKK
jgi:hypothetical protein